MKPTVLLGSLLLMLTASAAIAQPMLWFAKADLPRLRQVVTAEPEATIWRGIQQRAEDYCNPQSSQYADPARVDQRPSGDVRQVVLGHYFGRRLTDWMEILGFAYQLTGDERLARQGVAVLDAAARKLTVTEPDIARGFAGARGDIMRGLAVGYDWLGEAMTAEQKTMWAVTAAGYVRSILAEQAEPKTWWRTYHNFNGVAVGAAGLLALELQPYYPDEATQWRTRCAEIVAAWLEHGFDAQGAYLEGVGYSAYGLSNALRFADALQRAGGPDLFASPRLRRLPHFLAMQLLPGERVYEARNDSSYAGFDDPTLLRLAAAYNSGLAKWLWLTTGSGESPFQIIWANAVAAQTPGAAGVPLAEHFVGRGLCVWRTGWGTNEVMFAVECGPYYPVTHNQADEGHFTLYGLGQRWAIDSGYGNNRLPGGRDSTMAHNCVLIDGAGHAPSGAGVGTSGKIAVYEDTAAYGYALADGTEAYNRNNVGEPGAVVDHALRHTLFVRPGAGMPAYAVILDDLRKDDQAHEYTWLLHLPDDLRVALRDDGAVLTPESAAPQCFLHTPVESVGRGEAVWTFNVPQAGEYTLWGRVRAVGSELGKADSFFVQVDDGRPTDWHMPTRSTWTWGKVTAGVAQQALTYNLTAGPHTLRLATRETGAQCERLFLVADPQAQAPFAADAPGVLLLPEQAAIQAPMALVRTAADTRAPHLRLWLSAAAPVRFTQDGYDGHQRLKASVTTTAPEFVALLLPVPGDVAEPAARIARQAGTVRVTVRSAARVDEITWPARGDRRPILTSSKP